MVTHAANRGLFYVLLNRCKLKSKPHFKIVFLFDLRLRLGTKQQRAVSKNSKSS